MAVECVAERSLRVHPPRLLAELVGPEFAALSRLRGVPRVLELVDRLKRGPAFGGKAWRRNQQGRQGEDGRQPGLERRPDGEQSIDLDLHGRRRPSPRPGVRAGAKLNPTNWRNFAGRA